MDEYSSLVATLKALTQGKAPDTVTLPMAENEWNTRPDEVSYGIVSLDFESDAMYGDDQKKLVSYEGSVDLYSLVKNGAGWVDKITEALTAHCGGCWSLNSHVYERDTGLFHWEWTFEVS